MLKDNKRDFFYTGPSSSKREKPSRSSSAVAIPKSPTSGEDESSTDAGGGFVMAETVGHYIDSEGNQVIFTLLFVIFIFIYKIKQGSKK